MILSKELVNPHGSVSISNTQDPILLSYPEQTKTSQFQRPLHAGLYWDWYPCPILPKVGKREEVERLAKVGSKSRKITS